MNIEIDDKSDLISDRSNEKKMRSIMNNCQSINVEEKSSIYNNAKI